VVSFPPFRLDEADERLWKGTKLVSVRRKPFAILRYLVANPKRLVTHSELLAHVWGGAWSARAPCARTSTSCASSSAAG
jgi:DNA-binding winged helix-turn-helix (wHTH) protein